MSVNPLPWVVAMMLASAANAAETKLSDVYLRIDDHEERIG